MASMTIPQSPQMIIDPSISPTLRRAMKKARKEYANKETISCSTPEEMQQYFDSL